MNRTPTLLCFAALSAALTLPGCTIDLGFGNCDTPGVKGRAGFSWSGICDPLAARAMAAGGAVSTVSLSSLDSKDLGVTEVKSSDPSVVTFTLAQQDLEATSGKPGEADLILLDSAGEEIDRTTVRVKATSRIGLDQGWGAAPGPTILAGTTQTLHATTFDGDDVLVGVGAVQWTLGDPLEPAIAIVFGDGIGFTGKAGAGEVTADCIDAHLTLPVTVVDASSITGAELAPATLSFASGASGQLLATARAGDAAVFGATCTWSSTPAGLEGPSVESSASLGRTAATTYRFTGKAGTYVATCAMPGGASQKATITVTP